MFPEYENRGPEWPQKKEPLLVQTVDNVIKELLLRTTPLTVGRINKGQGMLVRNIRREGEDPEADIDIKTETSMGKVLSKLNKKYDISFKVYSEHNNFTIGNRPPYYPTSIDPTENTDELVKKLSNFYVTPWTILSIYNVDNTPIGAGAVNLAHSKESFINRDGKNYHHVITDLKSENDSEFSPQPLIEDLRAPNLVIATYRSKEKYDLEFLKYFSKLKQERHPSSTIISTGGNYIYVPLALGFVHIYIAPIEPYEEVFSGLPFLLAQGGEIRVISPEGKSTNINKFQPELQRERANLLLASRSTKLLDQAEEYYHNRQQELKLK